MIAAALRGTGSALAAREVSTGSLLREALPHRDPVEMARRIGIRARYWLGEGETAATLGAQALEAALGDAGIEAQSLRRVIFVSSTGGDHLIPATANALTAALGLDDTCDAFDLNNSCAGFVSALDVAARSVATGLLPVAVVVSETFSRYLSPDKPRPYLVLGDAAAAVIVGAAREEGEGVLGSWLANSAALRGRMTTQHPGVTRRVEAIDFAPSSEELTASALAAIDRSSRAALAQAGLGADDVTWWLPHQPNGEMLERIVAGLGVPRERLVPVVDEVGSVGAASIPLSFDRLSRSGRLKDGDLVMMAGVGSGTGYGAMLWRVGSEDGHGDGHEHGWRGGALKGLGARAAGAAWQGYWSAMRRYHRYEVRGLEHLERPGAMLIAGYHGRPIAHDLCMLQSLLRRRGGAAAMPRAIMHTYFRTTPVLRWIFEGYDFLDGDEAMLAEAVARGDKLIVTPGGTREGTRSFRDRYRVEWGGRTGYLKLALQHRLPIVPAAAWGVDDTFLALNDGYALGKRAGLPKGLPLWVGIGPLGLWPLSPPWPVKITTVLGAPIEPEEHGRVDPRDRDALLALHARVTGAVQALLDARRGPPPGSRSGRPTRLGGSAPGIAA